MEDYSDITAKALTICEAEIFNPNFKDERKWKKFKKKILKSAENINDDLEMVFSFFYYARKLPISHLALVKKNNNEKHDARSMVADNIEFKEIDKNTALLTINSFGGSAEEMNKAFDDYIFSKDYQNLIVDLRDNGGGSIE
ncbi:MAG: S41 family peptidase, partial [Chitinophagales bacterium]|nr:S41 family peptidase [Chitinophagales bacterium]